MPSQVRVARVLWRDGALICHPTASMINAPMPAIELSEILAAGDVRVVDAP